MSEQTRHDDGVETVQRIAVATDRSEGGDRAVRWATDLAERSGSKLAVIQVVAPTDDSLRPMEASLRAHVGQGPEIIVAAHEDVALALVEAAMSFAADLLVVGNSGMQGRTEFLLGNVANRVTHLATCSVLVVNSNQVAPDGADDDTGSPRRRAQEIASVLGETVISWRRSASAESPAAQGAVLLRTALERLGPTFCKLGQMLSTRPDLIPADYVTELEKLQSDVPPMTEREVVHVLEQELGVPWEDVFADIDPDPLAAGTIGQVHRAGLVDGSRVVVKVQREGIGVVIDNDLKLLETAARAINRSRRVRDVVDLPQVFSMLGDSLRAELDFRLEAANLDRMATILEPFDRVEVPRCHHELSSRRVLVMDEVPGVPMSEATGADDGEAAARQLLQSFFAQILEHGFFHADPHPGNLLWHDGRVWMIDLGMVGELDEDERGRLVLLLLAVSRQEIDMIVELTSGDLTTTLGPERVSEYRDGLAEILASMHGQSMADLDLAEFLDRLTRLSMTHGVALPTELMMVGKSVGQVQMTVTELAPEVDPVREASRFIIRMMTHRLGRRLDPQQLVFEVERMQYRLRQISDLIGSVTGANPGQGLEVGFRSAPVEHAIRQAGRTVGLGMSAGLAWIAASSAQGDNRRRTLHTVAGALTAAFTAEVVRQRRS